MPPPTPECEFSRISINDGALFTSIPTVTLGICSPYAAEMMVSNDGGFGGAGWEPYATAKPWVLEVYGRYVMPRFVYAAFKDADGTAHGTYFDDIIYDPNPPEGAIRVGEDAATLVSRLGGMELGGTAKLVSATKTDGEVEIYLDAQDDSSGVGEMQLSEDPAFSDATWVEYSALYPWTPSSGDGVKTLYARFRDRAGNASEGVSDWFVLDSTPPTGGMAVGQEVVGPGTVTMALSLGAEDNLSGVEAMRVSTGPAFTDTCWLTYTDTVTWQVYGRSEDTVYVQYRDQAGNESAVYSDTYLIDSRPPVVYLEVEPGDTLTRTLTILAYDEFSEVTEIWLSNDPLFREGVVSLPYTTTVEWAFDERRVAWVEVVDGVGNFSEPYPAFAAERELENKVHLPVIMKDQ